jgi:hypothetical protein
MLVGKKLIRKRYLRNYCKSNYMVIVMYSYINPSPCGDFPWKGKKFLPFSKGEPVTK